MRIVKNLGRGVFAMMALALIATAAPALAQAPPHYLDALADLRTARDYIQSDPRHQYEREKRFAVAEINLAIGEIKQAAWDDGKNTKYAPPAAPITDPWQPMRMAADWLAGAIRHLSTSQDPANQRLQQAALQHTANARKAIGDVINAAGH